MLVKYIVLSVLIIVSGFVFIASAFLTSKKLDSILKIIISGYISALLLFIGIVLTSITDYNLSYYIDIVTIYFVLGFANFVLYFLFFHRRA